MTSLRIPPLGMERFRPGPARCSAIADRCSISPAAALRCDKENKHIWQSGRLHSSHPVAKRGMSGPLALLREATGRAVGRGSTALWRQTQMSSPPMQRMNDWTRRRGAGIIRRQPVDAECCERAGVDGSGQHRLLAGLWNALIRAGPRGRRHSGRCNGGRGGYAAGDRNRRQDKHHQRRGNAAGKGCYAGRVRCHPKLLHERSSLGS